MEAFQYNPVSPDMFQQQMMGSFYTLINGQVKLAETFAETSQSIKDSIGELTNTVDKSFKEMNKLTKALETSAQEMKELKQMLKDYFQSLNKCQPVVESNKNVQAVTALMPAPTTFVVPPMVQGMFNKLEAVTAKIAKNNQAENSPAKTDYETQTNETTDDGSVTEKKTVNKPKPQASKGKKEKPVQSKTSQKKQKNQKEASPKTIDDDNLSIESEHDVLIQERLFEENAVVVKTELFTLTEDPGNSSTTESEPPGLNNTAIRLSSSTNVLGRPSRSRLRARACGTRCKGGGGRKRVSEDPENSEAKLRKSNRINALYSARLGSQNDSHKDYNDSSSSSDSS